MTASSDTGSAKKIEDVLSAYESKTLYLSETDEVRINIIEIY